MRQLFCVGILAALTACGTKGTITGKVTDGLTGAPVEGLRILAKTESSDLTCMTFEATTAADGSFVVDGTCGDHDYTLTSGDEARFLTGTLKLTGGDPAASAGDVKGWGVPSGAGVYILSAGELRPLRTFTDVKKATVLGTETVIRYPESPYAKDADWPQIKADDHLVVIGRKAIDELQVVPIVDNPNLKFEPDREGITHFSLGPWKYIGWEWTSDEDIKPKSVKADASKFVEAEEGDRAVRYIPSGAYPAGKYALLRENDRRTYLFEFSG